ncbi:hypothetical protein ACFPH6_02625 [Streptomyces xiangluensis]|uniref:Uncharacterized protein n=1 Tax=Streptomyces xiangluensis TaxID=2665720 RepID=A0ABV8YDV5_9ACTN
MPKKRSTRVWSWLFVVGYVAMAINLAIKAVTDSGMFMRAMAIFSLVVAAFVAGTVLGVLKARQKLSAQGPEIAPSDIST